MAKTLAPTGRAWKSGMRGAAGGLQDVDSAQAGLGRECPWQWWSGATQEDRESQAHSQTTLHPEAPRRLHGARSGPCGLQPSAAPLWWLRRDPRCPPRVHSSAAGGRGWGAGSWGGGRARLSGRGPQGPGHPPTLQPSHTLPTPGDPRAAPRKGVTHTQTAPSPHWCSYHPGAAWPARQSSKEPGPETGPGGPYHGHRPRPPHADTGPRGSQPSATQGAARSHTAASGAARASARLTPAPRRPEVSARLCSRRHE